jgi:mRNA-degrading endonuclease RelE of RelBE toxin-antitoxin system
MYELALRRSVERTLSKLARKDPRLLAAVARKVDEVLEDPSRYKTPRRPLQHLKRVHVGSSFVLVFSVDEKRGLVVIEDLDHHERVYKR